MAQRQAPAKRCCPFKLFNIPRPPLGGKVDAVIVKSRFRKMSLAGEHRHPDKGGNPEKFAELRSAYEALLSYGTPNQAPELAPEWTHEACEREYEHVFGKRKRGADGDSDDEDDDKGDRARDHAKRRGPLYSPMAAVFDSFYGPRGGARTGRGGRGRGRGRSSSRSVFD